MAVSFSSKVALSQSFPACLERKVRLPSCRVPCQAGCLIRAQTDQKYDVSDRKISTAVAANHGKLRLFIDSADKEVWKTWLPTGVFHGVTTNPLLLERAEVSCQYRSLRKLAHTALDLGAKEVQLQTWGAKTQDLHQMGSQLADIDSAIVVKIPITGAGLAAASKLTAAGARVTMTGLYSTHQILLAAGVGAEYAAPYLGRMILKGKDAVQDIQDMQRLLTGVNSQMRILVASIKAVDQILALALKGVSSYALPPNLLGELIVDRDTEEASRDFEQAAARNQPRLFL